MTDEEILALWSITADEIAHARSKDGADSFYREDCRIAFARAVAAQERERCAKVCEEEDVAATDDPLGVQECIAKSIRSLVDEND